MWRLIVVELYCFIISIQTTAIPSPSTSADINTQVQSAARLGAAVGAKHGYRYQVEFPSSQQQTIVSYRHQSAGKYEDNSSSASIASSTLAKYTNGYESGMDSSHTAPLENTVYSQPGDSNSSYNSSKHNFSPNSTGDYKTTKMQVVNDKSHILMTHLQQLPESSNKNEQVTPTGKPDMYLPPSETFHHPETNRRDGYIYEKPTNQLTLPNNNHNHNYFMADYQWYPSPSVPMNNEDDSVEVFPPAEASQVMWGENTKSQNYERKSETPLNTEAFANNHLLYNQQKQPEAFDGHNYDNYNSKVSLPNTKNEKEMSINSPYKLSSIGNGIDSDNPVEMPTQFSPLESSKIIKKLNNEAYKPARITSLELDSEIDDLSKTSLMVHFAGSVFSADGVPHPSKETVFPVDYNFWYDVRGWPEMGHQETRTDRTTRGRYWVGLPDGRLQVVEYTAGPQGFMPTVSYRSP